MATARPYRQKDRKNHWECEVSLGPDPKRPGRYVRRSFVLCPASCDRECSPFPEYRVRTKREAVSAADAIAKRLREGADLERRLVRSPSFADLVDRWLRFLAADNRSPNTLNSYAGLARRHLVPTFGDRAAVDITTAQIQVHLDGLRASGLSPATCERVLTVARQLFQWAVQRELVPTNPAREVRRPTQHKTRVAMPDRDTVLFALGVLDREASRWLATFALLAAATGARRGELCALRWADVDLADPDPVMRISRSVNRWRQIGPTKTHAARTVPLNGTARAALAAWRDSVLAEHREVEGDIRDVAGEWLVFASDDGPTAPRNPDAVTRQIKRVLDAYRAANPGALPARVWAHGLRHYAASVMLAGSDDPIETAKILGHASPKMTLDVYGHPVDKRRRTTVDLIDRALNPPSLISYQVEPSPAQSET